MKNLWEDVKSWLSETSQTVAREAEFLTKKGKLKLELYDLNRRLEKAFADLGGYIYDMGYVKKQRNFLRGKKTNDMIALIKKLEGQRGEKEKELKLLDDAMGRKIKE